MNAEREARREAARRAIDQLYYELIHNLVVETTRLGIEVKNLKMRVESLSSRLEFNERRARALESVVVYKPADRRIAAAAIAAASGRVTAALRRRRRNRTRRRRSRRTPQARQSDRKVPASAAGDAGDGAAGAAAAPVAGAVGAPRRRRSRPIGAHGRIAGRGVPEASGRLAQDDDDAAATPASRRRHRPDRFGEARRGHRPTHRSTRQRSGPSDATDGDDGRTTTARRTGWRRPRRAVKLAVVVQRYGQAINGGAELHARYIAEHLARHAEVEVLTTCATDYVTWRNELPPGVEHGQRRRRSAGSA